MYKPPNSIQELGHKIHREVEKAYKNGKVMVIMGNFNMHVDSENQTDGGSQEKEFVDVLRDSFLEQLVVESTREQAILDLLLCDEADLIREIKAKEPLGDSDHNMIELTLQFEREKIESEVTVLQLNKGNCRVMREELDRIDWERSLAGKTVEQQWQEFLGVIQETQQ
eukprot:g22521.t1